MNKTVIMAFDLSTTCTGVAIATISDKKLKHLCTMSIKPTKVKPTELGFLPRKLKVIPKKGRPFNAYVKYAGEVISKTEKERRDRMVRKASEELRLKITSQEISKLFEEFQPNIILMEANMAFRSIEVTRKLAEVAGALQALAASKGIPVHKINVHTARSKYDIYREMGEYAKLLSEAQKKRMDLVKETIKYILLKKYVIYGLSTNMTTDESDALLLLDYWIESQKLVLV